MAEGPIRKIRTALGRTLLCPKWWLGAAVLMVATFGIFHLLGWRSDTMILSGTLPAQGADATILRGVLYTLAYFGAVIVSPILVLAAALHAVMIRFIR